MDTIIGVVKSKTMWFSLLVTIVGFLTQYGDQLKSFLPEKYYGYVMAFVGVATAILRLFTTSSLADKGKAP